MNTRKKILIVDDEQLNLEFFEVMLSKLGFTVDKANDGLEALEKVRQFLPDLILLDNIMPRMSGWEVTKTLKADPKFQDIPVVMFSALDDVKDKLEGYELGVEDYITKPFNFSEVLARIRVVLRNRELFAQIAVREERLCLAEALNKDTGDSLRDFIRGLDEMDVVLAKCSRLGDGAGKVSPVLVEAAEKSRSLRQRIAELEGRIEKTMVEWDELKKNEVGLRELEDQNRAYGRQE
ncbi:MAG: response regulator [Treponema sp.]|jgi:DNA-binding response OmpR family regulator|nr:response regulator [Treponema sp.]